MEFLHLFCFYLLILGNACLALFSHDSFEEELLITPLENGFVNSHFKFTTEWNTSLPLEQLHYNLFPRSLGQVIRKHRVQELHLTLTQGLWRHDKWGYPPVGAPPGTQLWVWFNEDTEDVDREWGELVNALSGLFCASLNFIDKTNTVQPQLSFRPLGLASGAYARDTRLVRYASLPREVVCTENLTPWKKLLPCESRAGLASLFKADKLYNAHYHSLGVHLRPVCPGSKAAPCVQPAVELSQSLNVVFRPLAPRDQGPVKDWSLRTLFGKPLSGPCPMATVSRVVVDITRNNTDNPLSVSPAPDELLQKTVGDENLLYAVYDVKPWANRRDSLNVGVSWVQPIKYGRVSQPPLLAHRYLSGYGQERGGISCLLRNNLPQPLRVIYTETIPWYMRLYLHTLNIQTGASALEPDNVVFVPGRDRSRPYLLEVVLTLPPTSDTTLRIDYDKAFLRWTEYPPDANIGFFINSAIVSVMLPSAANVSGAGILNTEWSGGADTLSTTFQRLYTEPLLIQLPTPDFSMPYNVICLTCTVIAIAFGSIHNLTTRQFAFVESAEKEGLFKRLLGKLRGKKGGKEEEAKEKEKGEEEKKEEDEKRLEKNREKKGGKEKKEKEEENVDDEQKQEDVNREQEEDKEDDEKLGEGDKVDGGCVRKRNLAERENKDVTERGKIDAGKKKGGKAELEKVAQVTKDDGENKTEMESIGTADQDCSS